MAAVNGQAAGAGFSLALACDLRLAGERAAFNFAYGGTRCLHRRRGELAAAARGRPCPGPRAAVGPACHPALPGTAGRVGQRGSYRMCSAGRCCAHPIWRAPDLARTSAPPDRRRETPDSAFGRNHVQRSPGAATRRVRGRFCPGRPAINGRGWGINDEEITIRTTPLR
ncbi:enoyl-CoA hydratase-related protein [Micromonospora sp. NPDC005203]|uniref:enoyl-CoA hydratase-related protein n=1 Tax=Micromonospora sp. NPDC005203 TaxID=3364226 RepID=UPI0036CE0B7A